MFDTLAIAAALPVASATGRPDSPSDSGFAELMAAEVAGGRTGGTNTDTNVAKVGVTSERTGTKEGGLGIQTPASTVPSLLTEETTAIDGTIPGAPMEVEADIAPLPVDEATADDAATPVETSEDQPVSAFVAPASAAPAPLLPSRLDKVPVNADASVGEDGALPPADAGSADRALIVAEHDAQTIGGETKPTDLNTSADVKSVGVRALVDAQVKDGAPPSMAKTTSPIAEAAETVTPPPAPSSEKTMAEKAPSLFAQTQIAKALGAAGVSRIEARTTVRADGSAVRLDDAGALEGDAEGVTESATVREASAKAGLVRPQASVISEAAQASSNPTTTLSSPLAGTLDMTVASDMQAIDDGLLLTIPLNAPGFGVATPSTSILNTGLATSTATAETVAALSAQIARRLEGRSTRFEIGLTPDGLGQVDVTLDIDADGGLTARLAFDNPLAATDLRGRADELRRQLQEAGFTVGQDALSFTERDAGQSGGRDGRSAREFLAESARAFAGAGRLNDAAETALTTPVWASRSQTLTGVDVKV